MNSMPNLQCTSRACVLAGTTTSLHLLLHTYLHTWMSADSSSPPSRPPAAPEAAGTPGMLAAAVAAYTIFYFWMDYVYPSCACRRLWTLVHKVLRHITYTCRSKRQPWAALYDYSVPGLLSLTGQDTFDTLWQMTYVINKPSAEKT